MKTTRSYLILIVLFLGSLTGNSVYAQYAPGGQLPQIGYIGDYDWIKENKGFIRYMGDDQSIPIDKRLYSIWAGKRDNSERFRVSANGTTSILGATNGTPALNFYTANNYYLGSIGFPGEELTISGLYGIRINPGKKNNAFFSINRTDIFTPLYLPLKGRYADENIGFKVGRNQEPVIISSFNEKRLRIGAKGGISFWGDGNADVNDIPDFAIYSDKVISFFNNFVTKIGRNKETTLKNNNGGWLRVGSKNGIALWGNDQVEANDQPDLSLRNNRVTIGAVSSSAYKLNVGGSIYTENAAVKMVYGVNSDGTKGWIGTVSNHGLYLGTNNGSYLYLDADNRNVYIGLTTSIAEIRQELKDKYKLFVAKGVLSEDYGIGPKSSWSDFVFNKDYALKTIPEVEEFISENSHLPDVPSAKQVAEDGYSQHDMNKILLQKIEELTLYTIQQQKEIQDLKTELNNLKK